ncbi:histidine kinase [Paracrocinitomix mangrovi]|uniref:sensor histidine kinase n=1 Tax=Paracrocinitomix mangrovi TaxID=2862509 RepID=UPI001C8D48BB|nr:histidine kinase [Paracrocinitomix mangrovi]UKN01152.1 histidine kinase [Paracrocinitomix mangrovi]
MSSDQIDEISKLLVEYSAGNYDYKGPISDDLNELDMIISGINILGEELESANVSRDYFSSIFNAVTDLVMILDEEGRLTDINIAVELTLGISIENSSYLFDDFIQEENIFKKIKSQLEAGENGVLIETVVKGKRKNIIGQLTCSKILDRYDHFKGYLVSIKDITEQKERENLILKTIFQTQQAEHKRIADDLHDSLGQELSMTKLMISNLKKQIDNPEKSQEIMATCMEILDGSIKHLREISFNLMPSVLTRGGLNMAIADMVGKLKVHDNLEVIFSKNDEVKRFEGDLEIVIYRIAQEFVNNMIKHANATKLWIELNLIDNGKKVSLLLKDNGVGFDTAKLDVIRENRGYNNLKTKVKAFNGELIIESKIGKGTSTHVIFPVIQSNEEV